MVRVRYFAAAQQAAGLPSENVEWEGRLASLLEHLSAAHPEGDANGLSLAEIFERCTFLLNGVRARESSQVTDGDQLDILPPFAGG